MAYSKKQMEDYRVTNARKTNKKKFPNGYIYILCIPEFDLYKIGVSQRPKRRIRDIKAVIPFESEVIYLQYFKDVYTLEHLLHQQFKDNRFKKEWFKIYPEDIKLTKEMLNELFVKENE